MYLVAIIDLYSRFVANWSVSNTIMDAEWCRHTLEQAIATHGKPEVVNTDQGSQFTSDTFSQCVIDQHIRLSMEGKGRAIDNAFIKRAWRSVKYEKLYLDTPKDGIGLYQSLAQYFRYYNLERRDSGINNQISNQRYTQQFKKAALYRYFR